MPQIVVTAGNGTGSRARTEVLRERVVRSDLESQLFINNLVERIEWALADADTIEAAEEGPVDPGAGRSGRRAA